MTFSRVQALVAFCMIAVISLLVSIAGQRFNAVIEPDSSSYLTFDWSTAKSALSSTRTFGYPLFLAAVGAISDKPQSVPVAHWLALVLAAFTIQVGLTASGYRRSTAVAAAGTLLFGNVFMSFGQSILADSLACSLSLAAAGCFLASLSAEPRRWAWCGLTVLTFMCYQTRPSHLFLIPLWPTLGFFLDRFIVHRAMRWQTSLRRGAMYAAITVIPLMAFCTLRACVVGHWGLVSFGGYNLIGVVGQFLDQESADAMPVELKPLACEMLKRSREKNAEPPLDFDAMDRMYNLTVWDVAVPAAKEIHGEDPTVINRVLSQIANELLRRHYRKYVRWLVWNAVHGIKQVVHLTLTNMGTRLLGIVFLIAHARSLWRGPSNGRREGSYVTVPEGALPLPTVRFLEVHLLFWTAIAFAAAKVLLVILVEPTIERYMAAAMPLLPAAIAVFVVHYWESELIPQSQTD